MSEFQSAVFNTALENRQFSLSFRFAVSAIRPILCFWARGYRRALASVKNQSCAPQILCDVQSGVTSGNGEMSVEGSRTGVSNETMRVTKPRPSRWTLGELKNREVGGRNGTARLD